MSSLITTGRPASGLLAIFGLGARITGSRGYAKAIQPRKQSSPQPPPPSSLPSSKPSSSSSANTSRATRSPPRLLFSPSDVPTAEEWQSALTIHENKDLTAQECVRGANTYVSVATQYESQWRNTLQSSHSLSPYFLHWLGALTLALNTSKFWRLGIHMLRSASELGYTPSTLTLRRVFHSMHRKPNFGHFKETIHYRSAETRFQQVLKTGQDPDAFTLQGIILNDEGDHDRALHHFRSAHKTWTLSQQSRESVPSPVPQVDVLEDGQVVLPKPREPRWEWEVACLLGEADILKMRGHLKQAKALYRVAALELDNPQGFLCLANLMDGPRESPERRMYLLKAAVSGQVDACRELGAVEELRAHEKGITERETEHRLLLSKEWVRLANDEVGDVVPGA